jgi:hypothetical protein
MRSVCRFTCQPIYTKWSMSMGSPHPSLYSKQQAPKFVTANWLPRANAKLARWPWHGESPAAWIERPARPGVDPGCRGGQPIGGTLAPLDRSSRVTAGPAGPRRREREPVPQVLWNHRCGHPVSRAACGPDVEAGPAWIRPRCICRGTRRAPGDPGLNLNPSIQQPCTQRPRNLIEFLFHQH